VAVELDGLGMEVGNLVPDVQGLDGLGHDLGDPVLGILADGIDRCPLDRNELLRDGFHTKCHLGEYKQRQKYFLGGHQRRSRFGIHGSIRQCDSYNLHESK
jgi:hypothetical protein